MCDTIAGELLVCFHHWDTPAYTLMEDIFRKRIRYVEVIDNLNEKLYRMGLSRREDVDFEFHRLGVPPGEEGWKINYLQHFYKRKVIEAISQRQVDPAIYAIILDRSDYHFQVTSHSFLWINSQDSFSSGQIQLSTTHDDYLKMVGLTTKVPVTHNKRVAILDTGGPSLPFYTITEKGNFVTSSKDATDDNGHGTVVTEIIHSLCPGAELLIYKVADENGRASEWDTLAALAAQNGANIVNMSLAFGLADRNCPICGRESHTSRSFVFENLLDQVVGGTHGPLVVAAAGNNRQNELAFPARFGSVLAIESIDKSYNMSEFTNWSTINQEGRDHENVFVLPGGQKDQSNKATEYVATSGTGKEYYGTSFSAAYASGLIAALWSEDAHAFDHGNQILHHLRLSADRSFPGYDPSLHGNGMMRLL